MMAARRFGREIQDELERILRGSQPPVHRKTAAAMVGIHPSTLATWMTKGGQDLEEAERRLEEDPESSPILTPHAEFFAVISQAEASALHNLAEEMWLAEDQYDEKGRQTQSARPTIDRCRWWMERRYPRLFGKAAQRLELTGADGGPVQVEVDAHEALLRALSSVAPSGPEEEGDQEPFPEGG